MSKDEPDSISIDVRKQIKPSTKRLLMASRKWSGAITIVGGLIIFFSWIVSNTLRDQYFSIQSKIDAARKEHEMSNETTAIRHALRGIEYRVSTLQNELLKQIPEMERALIPIRQTFDHCDDFFFTISAQDTASSMQARLLQAHPGRSKMQSQIEGLLKEYRALSLELIEARKRATFYVYATGVPNEAFLKQAKDAVEQYRKVCDTTKARSQEAADELQTASNIIQDELSTEMANAKWRAIVSAKTSIFLYVLGSMIALYGGVFEKVFSKPILDVSKVAESHDELIEKTDS